MYENGTKAQLLSLCAVDLQLIRCRNRPYVKPTDAELFKTSNILLKLCVYLEGFVLKVNEKSAKKTTWAAQGFI